MRTEADQIAKRTLLLALEDHGSTVLQQEVCAPDVQYIDLWHTPAATRAPAPPWLELVFRMAAEPCLWEPFSAPVRPSQLRDNMRKQLVWHHQLCQEARRQGAPQPSLPLLWVVSPGRPERLLEEYDVLPLTGWPAGYYHFNRGLRIGLLILPELPSGVETLILRLLGGARTRGEAIAELESLGDSDAGRALRAFVVELRQRVAHDKDIEEAEREAFMTAAQAEFQKFKQDILEKGIEQGLEKGIEQGLEKGIEQGRRDALRHSASLLCQAFGIELTEDRAAALQAMDAAALDALLAHLAAHQRWPA